MICFFGDIKEVLLAAEYQLTCLYPWDEKLLLIECKDKEAVHELERFCGISNASVPIRLRAYLLERVDPTNSFALSTCVEDSLKSDPTCRNYSPESLLEMIALYLDAVFVEYNTWRNLLNAFLKSLITKRIDRLGGFAAVGGWHVTSARTWVASAGPVND
ncbi:hypothetical protein GH714_018579 [Hevea brasiliensis]|uniref:Uncharacterized protein n=1 Tax=Hevea brasiliensis TaxID=3981 RepID=A0A6A6MEP9_HEVBR|nr:hypothetical protein GH714_018579 [Hevea brasiliensis]